MLRGLFTAATGMIGQQLNVDQIANNIANVNTPGFKKMRIDFEDLLYQTLRPAGATVATGVRVPTGIQVGHGSRPIATRGLFTPGSLINTGNQLDLAILGDGFFRVLRPDGRTAYTRDGSFALDDTGQLVTSHGYTLDPTIVIPDDTLDVSVGLDGTVNVTTAGQEGSQNVGQILLTRFVNPAGRSGMRHRARHPTEMKFTGTDIGHRRRWHCTHQWYASQSGTVHGLARTPWPFIRARSPCTPFR